MLNYCKLQKPIIVLSPMADMTDSPFCQIVKMVSGGSDYPIIFREMVSSEAIIRGNEESMKMVSFTDVERPLIQQIFGSNPNTMGQAAGMIEKEYSPDGVDINMGCPQRKITKNMSGCALMQDVKRAVEIVSSVRESVSIPVSVKMRLGWSSKHEIFDFVPKIAGAGADMISIHGRTREQRYVEPADWRVIGEVKNKVSIPVLANGDVLEANDALKILDVSGCDGMLVARGALGNPWIFPQIRSVLSGRTYKEPTIEERVDVITRHLDLHLQHYGDRGIVTFRKHLTWYLKGLRGIRKIRRELHTCRSKDELLSLLERRVLKK